MKPNGLRVIAALLSIFDRLLGLLRGYSITPWVIRLRQRNGWVELRRNDIAAIKFETVSRIIIRFYDGHRVVVCLFNLSNSGCSAVCNALQEALRQNECARGLWDGANVE